MFAPWQRIAAIDTGRIGCNYTVRLTNLIAGSEQRPQLCRQAASQFPERNRQPGTDDCTACVGCSVACGDHEVA